VSAWPRAWRRGEQFGECGYGFEQQGADAGLLVGGAAGTELGDGAAVLGLGGELADAGGGGGVRDGRRGAGRGVAGHGQSRVSSATAFLAQVSSMRSLPAAAPAMIAAVYVQTGQMHHGPPVTARQRTSRKIAAGHPARTLR
jgi:hypothetical protein